VREAIPDEVSALIERFIESVEHLEILLFLFQWEKGSSVSEIYQRIQSSPSSVGARLAQFEEAGLVWKDADGLFRFKRTEPAVVKSVEQLAECYRTMRVRIIEAIYTRKTDAVRSFADAFKLKKKE
jgi:predicted transcriptional regulator